MKSLLSAGLNASGSGSSSCWGIGVTTPERGVKDAAAATWDVKVEALGTANGCGELKAGASTFRLFLLCSSTTSAKFLVTAGSNNIFVYIYFSNK